jgi:hypothetical protein
VGDAKQVAKDYFGTTSSLSGSLRQSLSKPISTTSLKLGKKVHASLPGLKKGITVTATLRTFDGRTFKLPSKKMASNGTYNSPSVKPGKRGRYTLTFKAGKITRVLVIQVR